MVFTAANTSLQAVCCSADEPYQADHKAICCRSLLQKAKLHSQGDKPEASESLRHSMEKEMQQQVTQLEVGSSNSPVRDGALCLM